MKTSKTILLAALALGLSGLVAVAQDNQGPGAGRQRRQQGEGAPGQPGGPGQGGGQRMMGGPLMAALDANRDGTIDQTEINNASAALRSLDKNGDGKLTAEEIRPQRPPGQGGQDGAPRGPRGPGQGGQP